MNTCGKVTATAAGLLFFSAVLALQANADERYSYIEHLDTIQGTGKTLNLTVGIGSGAFRLPSDPEGVLYTITDRGPNFDTVLAGRILGKKITEPAGKVFPTPYFTPSIYKLKIADGQVEVLEKIQIKTTAGIPVSGISNTETEKAWDINGKALPYDPNGIDAEGLVKLQDGTFWIGEEYGPSILHLAADGRILERWVPEGVGKTLEGAGYTIKENLPAILRSRPLNRGIESMAVSPDEKYLYFSLQSPLANPDKATYKRGRNVRLFKLDRKAGKVVGEYLYQLDLPDTFKSDNAEKPAKQNAVKVSELTGVGTDRLVVLERVSRTTKFYLIDLNKARNILGSKWDLSTTSPTLEQTTDVEAISKKLLLDTDERPGMMTKIEGITWNGDGSWYMINDNDFGITGDKTTIMKIKMPLQ